MPNLLVLGHIDQLIDQLADNVADDEPVSETQVGADITTHREERLMPDTDYTVEVFAIAGPYEEPCIPYKDPYCAKSFVPAFVGGTTGT